MRHLSGICRFWPIYRLSGLYSETVSLSEQLLPKLLPRAQQFLNGGFPKNVARDVGNSNTCETIEDVINDTYQN
jgi:hypothetical protein